MAVYVYCPRKSQGALELVHGLEAKRIRKFDGMDFWDRGKRLKLEADDVVVCWGSHLPPLEGLRVLNSADHFKTKYEEICAFINCGVSTVAAYDHSQIRSYKKGQELGLLPRRDNHVGGSDLLTVTMNPDYWVFKLDIKNEYRIHMFNGKSIRAGRKILRDGFVLTTEEQWRPHANLAHPWIRSFEAGWKISYDNFDSTPEMRSLAQMAVASLGLVFGAVDLAELSDGIFKVLEVNRAPGIEGNTVNAYVKAIKKWVDKVEDREEGNPVAKKRPRARPVPRPVDDNPFGLGG